MAKREPAVQKKEDAQGGAHRTKVNRKESRYATALLQKATPRRSQPG